MDPIKTKKDLERTSAVVAEMLLINVFNGCCSVGLEKNNNLGR